MEPTACRRTTRKPRTSWRSGAFPASQKSPPGGSSSSDAEKAVDGSEGSGWSLVGNEVSEPHEAIFLPVETLELIDTSVLRIEMQQEYRRLYRNTIGRFRISVTDDERILRACREFGAEARMTSPDHPSGTDRIAEIVLRPVAQHRIVAENRDLQGGCQSWIIRRAIGRAGILGELHRALGQDDPRDAHPVLGERPGLVRQKHIGRAQGLDRGQTVDQNVVRRHPPHSAREC